MKTSPSRILAVDDEHSVRTILGKALAAAGYSVDSVASGEQALKAASTESFQLVITDINMPGKDGIETILLLRGRQPKVKIIAMSGGGSDGMGNYLPLAATLGAQRIMAKPFSMQDFLSAVWDVIGEPALESDLAIYA